jgi:hypothetical protein
LGQPGLAPPLADSEWVLGPDQRLARILLHGAEGPITVAGTDFRFVNAQLGHFRRQPACRYFDLHSAKLGEFRAACRAGKPLPQFAPSPAGRQRAWTAAELSAHWPLQIAATNRRRRLRVVYMAEQEEAGRRRVALKVIKLGMDTKRSSPGSRPSGRRWP